MVEGRERVDGSRQDKGQLCFAVFMIGHKCLIKREEIKELEIQLYFRAFA